MSRPQFPGNPRTVNTHRTSPSSVTVGATSQYNQFKVERFYEVVEGFPITCQAPYLRKKLLDDFTCGHVMRAPFSVLNHHIGRNSERMQDRRTKVLRAHRI